MLTSLVEAILARNQNIGTTSILGARIPNHSWIFAPEMHKIFLVEIMSEVLSAMTSEKRINSTLPLTDLRPMNGTRHLREL